MKCIVLAVWVLFLAVPSSSAQTLSPGDIAIIGVNSDNPDLFGFVALVDLPSGTQIGFVDHGWQASGSFRTNEDEYFYTASSGISRGTVVQVTDTDGSPRFSTSGDQLIAFQGAVTSPTMIYAVNFEGAGVWQVDATSSNTSALPTGLVNGSTAVAIDECDNIAYSGSTSGTRSELLSLIGDKSNWICDNGDRLIFISSFTVTDSGSNSAPEFVSPTLTLQATAGDQVSIQYSATDADSAPITYGALGLPAGATIDPSTGAFEWTTQESDTGANTFTITASDGMTTASISVTITVVSVVEAHRPFIVERPNGIIVPGGTLAEIIFSVADPEGGDLTYDIVPGNLGAQISLTSGKGGSSFQLFQWTPPIEPGIQHFSVTMTDDEGLSVGTDIYVGGSGTLFQGQSGSTLLANLQSAYSPAQTLGYNVARDTLYAIVETDLAGFVEGIYTGFRVRYTGGDPSSQMFAGGINAEHTWPQSMGAGVEPQKSDMHSLFPAKDNVNSTRSNHPYDEIPDDQTASWFRDTEILSSIPASDIDEYSEFASGRFEPRESVKGDVARAVLYFKTIYASAADQSFFDVQSQTLGEWNETDSPSGEEIQRSGKIRLHQGNINPFLLDSSLANRLFSLGTDIEPEDLPKIFGFESVYPNPVVGQLNLRIGSRSVGDVDLRLFDVLGREVLHESLRPNRPAAVNVRSLATGVYVLRISSGSEVDAKKILILR